jgi:apolipoprotein N-acyltransferase
MELLKKNFLNFSKSSLADSLYVIFLGIMSSYSLPPYNYFIINFITFSLLFIFLLKKKNISNHKTFFKYGWYFGFGYFLFSLYWVAISLTFDENFRFLIPLVIILLPVFLSIFYGLVTCLFSIFYSKNVISSFLLFSVLFGGIEFIRGFMLTGFPWNLIAFSFSDSLYFIQILSVIGTYSFNLICISLFTVPAILILRKSIKEVLVCIIFMLVSVAFLVFGNLQISHFNSLKSTKNPYTIRVVSPKISLNRFHSNQDELKIINELINLSSPQKKEPMIYLWPEGIISDSYLTEMNIYKNLFSENFGKDDLIIMGLNNLEKKNDENLLFNTLAVFDSQLKLIQKYNKVNLVPFGEFIPFHNTLGSMGFKTITNEYKSFSSGHIREPINIKKGKINLSLLPLICYEIIYSGKLSKNKNFDYIINISEDGWFGNSIGPRQHFKHTVFRSIESGKYIIRSANNGISALINPMGIVEKEVKLGSTGYIDFSEFKSIKLTPFLLYGNKIFIILILLYIFLIFSSNKLTNE